MSTRYLIGRAELLTYPIDAPKKKPSDKVHPYTLNDAKKIIIPEIEIANSFFQALPAKACADDLAVACLVLHPAYLAKSFFPKLLLDQVGLASIGARTRRIQPRRQTRRNTPSEAETTELFVAGTRTALQKFSNFARGLSEDMPVAEQFARIDDGMRGLPYLAADDRLMPTGIALVMVTDLTKVQTVAQHRKQILLINGFAFTLPTTLGDPRLGGVSLNL